MARSVSFRVARAGVSKVQASPPPEERKDAAARFRLGGGQLYGTSPARRAVCTMYTCMPAHRRTPTQHQQHRSRRPTRAPPGSLLAAKHRACLFFSLSCLPAVFYLFSSVPSSRFCTCVSCVVCRRPPPRWLCPRGAGRAGLDAMISCMHARTASRQQQQQRASWPRRSPPLSVACRVCCVCTVFRVCPHVCEELNAIVRPAWGLYCRSTASRPATRRPPP